MVVAVHVSSLHSPSSEIKGPAMTGSSYDLLIGSARLLYLLTR